ncbi:hypothetical protein [Paracoccus versutus]|uniref:PhiE125 gp8 family phage protein n=1 Tax=Paracoccus versutus TaxID=34007 RepID=A0A3D9XP58_PARVE|nr:hypothetical protein [Paracoccus versutus]REF69952.1 hypothetical protein BDD41_2671 [Paracoccus versutus]
MPIMISRSTDLPIDLDAAKKVLRVDFDDDDDMIRDLIDGETRRYEDFARRIVAQTVFRFRSAGWFTRIPIDLDPIRSIAGVFYLDPAMQEVELALTAYRFVPCSQGGYLGIYSDWPRPDLADVAFPVWFEVVAGADLPADSPAVAPLDPADRMNILHMVKQIYDHDDPLTEEQLRRRFSGRRLLW